MIGAVNGWRCVAGLLGLGGVIVGAVGAHAVADPVAAGAVERSSIYGLLHAAALLALAPMTGTLAALAKLALACGTLLFCGSIALRHLAGVEGLTVLTPIGGTGLIIGWGLVIAAALSRRADGHGGYPS